MEKKTILHLCLVSFIVFSHFSQAQESTEVNEQPIPIFIVCPYREDSLRAIYEGSLPSNGATNILLQKKLDSLENQIINESHITQTRFIWLFSVMGLIGIGLFFIARQIIVTRSAIIPLLENIITASQMTRQSESEEEATKSVTESKRPVVHRGRKPRSTLH